MKFLPIFTLIAALSQFVGLAFFAGAGTFETTIRSLPTYIQPAGWTFSIWGAIYLLSLIFAFYQVIPKNDNQLLRAVRLPASLAFIGSSLWLWAANSTGATLWLTIPILFSMAGVLAIVILQPKLPSIQHQLFSSTILFPYAAWTGIAQWLNVQAMLNNQSIIQSPEINVVSNVFFLACITVWSWYFFSKSSYNKWYGLVIVWATFGVVSANIPDGNYIIAILAGALGIATLAFIKRS